MWETESTMKFSDIFSRKQNNEQAPPSSAFRIPSVFLAGLLVLGSFGAGIAVGTARSYTHAQTFAAIFSGNVSAPSADLSQLWLAWNTLNDSFVPTTASSTRASDQ